MKNSQWTLSDIRVTLVLMMILFSPSWLMAKDEIMISSVDINGDIMTLFGEFEIKPGKSSKGGGAPLVVTLNGVILDSILVNDNEIEAVLPDGLEQGTHRVAVCKDKDKECPDLDGWPQPEDCNDGDPLVNPGAPEIPGDGIDNDCDGLIE